MSVYYYEVTRLIQKTFFNIAIAIVLHYILYQHSFCQLCPEDFLTYIL